MPETFADILEELRELEESEEKLRFLLSLANDLPSFLEEEKRAEYKISGCASNAYLKAEYRDGKMYFSGDADAQIPKGILAMFIIGCEGATPEEVLAISAEDIESIGIATLLSPSRINGAYQIFQRLRKSAEALALTINKKFIK